MTSWYVAAPAAAVKVTDVVPLVVTVPATAGVTVHTRDLAELGTVTGVDAEAPRRTEVVPAGWVGGGAGVVDVGVETGELDDGLEELDDGLDGALDELDELDELGPTVGDPVGRVSMLAVVAVNVPVAAVRSAPAPRTSAAATPATISPYSTADAPRSRRDP